MSFNLVSKSFIYTSIATILLGCESFNETGLTLNTPDSLKVQVTGPAACAIDTINSTLLNPSTPLNISGATSINISGWAYTNQKNPDQIFLKLQSANKTLYLNASSGILRPDVAQVTNSPAADRTGFSGDSVTVNLAGSSEYTVKVFVVSDDRLYECANIGKFQF
jgi:hypothetical protein